jgi:peptide/nickel transport system permease protein
MSGSEIESAPMRPSAEQDIRRIILSAPAPLLVLLGLFLIGGLVGSLFLLQPDLSRLVYRQSLGRAFATPISSGAWLGTDQLGRPMEWRLLAGLSISLGTAGAVTVIATTLGMTMGILAGFFGRTANRIITVIIDATWAYPTLLLAVVVAGIIGPGIWTVVWALGLTLWAAMAHIVKAQVLVMREQDFVLAAKALGYSRFYIALRHLVPNLLPIWILMATLFMSLTIIAEAGLSFIGIGAQSPTPSLGKTLAEGFTFASSSVWPLVLGSMTIVGLVSVLNSFGDYLGDAIDPRRRLTTLVRPSRFRTALSTVVSSAPTEMALIAAENIGVSAFRGNARIPVLTDFSVRLEAGRILGIVGESGSGKSVAARMLTGLLPAGLSQTGGRVIWGRTDIAGLSEENLRASRGSFVSMAFQDARANLDPLYTIGDQITEALRAHELLPTKELRRRVLDLLDRVGLSGSGMYERYPHQLSGGQLQRAGLAAALITGPKVLICDEPTTGLDATTQKRVVELVASLQRELGMAVIWISHDLDLVGSLADDILVVYAGQSVEFGAANAVLAVPRHPYTRGLIDSRPDLRQPRKGTLTAIPGSVPEPGAWPQACRFSPRCARALGICQSQAPEFLSDSALQSQFVRCHNPEPRLRG